MSTNTDELVRAKRTLVVSLTVTVSIFLAAPLIAAVYQEYATIPTKMIYRGQAHEFPARKTRPECHPAIKTPEDLNAIELAREQLKVIGFDSAADYEVTSRDESQIVLSAWSDEPKYIALCGFSAESCSVRKPDWTITFSSDFRTMKINDEPEIELP